ncbi:hypothetical protein M407DRAFT_34739 [Tulasnella calospora MUT 4182]|uniref:Uncharacterized protein n=1 Tax=Tulasnella calospora MUT 4182 TaxID=1051891 RepID=A0A0C3L1S3_9AGAM|nr:hypothetical protein M407DRAFT_34739 [Tulasnella calospora MUT 4182]
MRFVKAQALADAPLDKKPLRHELRLEIVSRLIISNISDPPYPSTAYLAKACSIGSADAPPEVWYAPSHPYLRIPSYRSLQHTQQH